ncbi:hypothetical protein DPMN_114001 [Dreissena polymorpha]|uniref:Sushi domain-containing protein n=1 Tax=Dreissena polymorpha TaxID=45954 RepID=A0A9D4KK17_DREPO|nr:hypothetical protein DPMN_114001 [Dreissena polymorpha]
MCYPSFGAVGSEYGVLIKSGSEGSVSITCPWTSLGRYDYTHSTSDGMETCLAPGDTWNMCADKKKMSFDLVSCSTKVAYGRNNFRLVFEIKLLFERRGRVTHNMILPLR